MIRLPLLLAIMSWSVPCLFSAEDKSAEMPSAPRAEPVRQTSRIAPADLELVKQVFQTRKGRPMDISSADQISQLESTWQSYWWSGEDALFNTKGLVITGKTDWGPDWKPYGLVGLEEQVTFERYGKRRHAHVGIGVKYAFSDQFGSFLEFRAQSSSAIPQEGLVRIGMHLSY